MTATTTFSLERFKGAFGFTATFRSAWSNVRKAKIEKIKTDTQDPEEDKKAKTRMKLSKKLIESPEYDAIGKFYNDLRNNFIYVWTVPSFFKEGFQLAGYDAVNTIEDRMTKAKEKELPALVEKFITAYPQQVEEARTVLEPVGQWNAAEYPPAEELRRAFAIEWNWINFSVPEALPPELRQKEQDKLSQQLTDAGEQITQALRVAFKELIAHASERLTTAPGEKKKIFDSMTGNVQEFIDTFSARNIMSDVELAKLVGQARQILTGVTAQKLRDYESTRDGVREGFNALKTELSKLVIEQPGRKFDLEEEEQAPTEQPQPEADTQRELAAA